jgi:predicted branched-subunit amino acid permease
MTRRSRTYLWQVVIGFGFLSGVWTALGIDPEEVILTTLGTAITAAYPDPTIRTLFLILPTALLIISVYGAFRKGKALGIIAVILAYAAGLSLLVSLTTALILLIFAILTGYLAMNRRMVKKITGR